jgi:hypothetical protein
VWNDKSVRAIVRFTQGDTVRSLEMFQITGNSRRGTRDSGLKGGMDGE